MLYFQVVILVATLMLVYYCEFTDTFRPVLLGFTCRDPDLSRPFPGPDQDSRVQPVFLYSVLGALPVVLISSVELVLFLLHSSAHLYDQDQVVMVADCCYVNPMVRRTFRFIGINNSRLRPLSLSGLSLNPMVRRTFRFIGVYAFGLFCTDIFVNAGQLVTGTLTPHFLSVCQPNYTALSCLDTPLFVSQSDACTGPPAEVTRARKSFPCKEAAVSFYSALYLTVYMMSCVGTRAGRLSAPLFCLVLLTLALLTGFNRVSEYRNHWSDVLSGQTVGGAVAAFLVFLVVHLFRDEPEMTRSPSDDTLHTEENLPPLPHLPHLPHINHMDDDDDKYIMAQSPASFNEVT